MEILTKETTEFNNMHDILAAMGIKYTADMTVMDGSQTTQAQSSLEKTMASIEHQDRTISYSFPSFSLEHPHLICPGASRRSKNEVQAQASGFLSRAVEFKRQNGKPSVLDTIPSQMLENIYSSFDVLVDARIRVYAKVLANHGLTLSKCNNAHNESNTGLQAVQYKLKTLLEIGTNISAGSIETQFVRTEFQDNNIVVNNSDKANRTVIVPFTIVCTFTDLQIPSPSGDNSSLLVSLKSNGKLSGIFDEKGKLLSLMVDVDSNELLRNMVNEATKVVSAVVDMTNVAWNYVQRSVPKSITVPSNVVPADSHKVASPSFGPLFERPSKMDIFHLDQDQSALRLADAASASAANGLDNDDNEPRPVISFENCINIVDYVIGEIDENILAPPKKKLRLDSMPL